MHQHDFIVLSVLLGGRLVTFLNNHLVIFFLIYQLVATASLSDFLTVFKGATVRRPDVILHQVLIKLTLEHRSTLEMVMDLHPNADTHTPTAAIILTRSIKRHVFVKHGRIQYPTDAPVFAGFSDWHRACRSQDHPCGRAVRTVNHHVATNVLLIVHIAVHGKQLLVTSGAALIMPLWKPTADTLLSVLLQLVMTVFLLVSLFL